MQPCRLLANPANRLADAYSLPASLAGRERMLSLTTISVKLDVLGNEPEANQAKHP
jgi:hypothetical protein